MFEQLLKVIVTILMDECSKTSHCVFTLTFSDINECALDLTSCDSQAKCVNNDGSFTCTCKVGYTGDGVKCSGKHSANIYVFVHAELSFCVKI